MGALDLLGKAGKGFVSGASQYLTAPLREAEQENRNAELLRDIQMIKEAGGINTDAGRQLLTRVAPKYAGVSFAPAQFAQEMTPYERGVLEARKPTMSEQAYQIARAIDVLSLQDPPDREAINILSGQLRAMGSAISPPRAPVAGPGMMPKQGWGQALEPGGNQVTGDVGPWIKPRAAKSVPTKPIPFTPPFAGYVPPRAAPPRPAVAPAPAVVPPKPAPAPIAAAPAGTPPDTGPSTQAEFEARVIALGGTDRAKAMEYYNKWAGKFKNAGR